VSRPVARAERARDLAAAALLTGGAGLYGYAFHGMRALAAGRATVENELWASLARFNFYTTVSRAGMVIAAAGFGLMLWSSWRHAARPSANPP